MPVEYKRTPDGAAVIAHCFGKLTEADIHAALDVAFGTRRIEPSLDRIATIDPKTRLHEIDFEVLLGIQRRVLEEETRDNREASFRSVLVYSSSTQKQLMQIYKAIWDGLNLPKVEFFISRSLDEAFELLGESGPGKG